MIILLVCRDQPISKMEIEASRGVLKVLKRGEFDPPTILVKFSWENGGNLYQNSCKPSLDCKKFHCKGTIPVEE